jgi:biopolymer transport protein ExbB
MMKQIKTLVVSIGLVIGLAGAGPLLAQQAQVPSTATAAATGSANAAPQAVQLPDVEVPKTALEENPYGLAALWGQGDFVAKTTLAILVLMSMSSWYVIVTKLVDQTKLLAQAEQVQKEFWGAASVRKGADLLKEHSPFRFIAEKGLESVAAHHGMLENVDLNTWVTMSIHRSTAIVQGRMQDGLALLATVGSTAPFVGLFGTVWGIYHALVKIGMSGQASIDKVAGPVGESLIMTAIGLAVAVPAVLGYNWLVRRNKSVMEAVNTFGYGLHALLLVAPKK